MRPLLALLLLFPLVHSAQVNDNVALLSWTQVGPIEPIRFVVANPQGGYVVTTSNGFVFAVSEDLTEWEDINFPFTSSQGGLSALAGFNQLGDFFVATWWECIYKYSQGIWTSVGLCGYGTSGQYWTEGLDNRLLLCKAGFLRGIYKSDDDGNAWASLGTGNVDWNHLMMSDSTLFAVSCCGGTGQKGLIKSEDNGENWNYINSSVPLSTSRCITSNGSGRLVVEADDEALHISADNGETWNHLTDTPAGSIASWFRFIDDSTLFVTTFNTDGSGSTPALLNTSNGEWSYFPEIPVADSYLCYPLGDRIFVGTSSGLYELSLPGQGGCTDTTACNFSEEADIDDGSCEYGCLYCGENTVWDTTLQACVGITAPADTVYIEPEACAPSCGEGTVWDPVNEECIIAIPADLNYDGCVTVNDLLVLLAVHGTCPPYPEWPDEPYDAAWTCGDSLTYWDYDYATVLIGDQCWFAENLRTTVYADGSAILEVTDNTAWSGLNTGARCDYDNDASNVATYGRLYNWYAVDDARSLCPVGWHVPTDGEWTDLENHIRSQGFNGTEGTALKSTYGWYNGGNGTDDFGFSALPGGFRYQ